MQKVLKFNFGVLQRPKLHIFDKGGKHTPSGIRATIHGGTSFSGIYMGGILGNIGSELIFPHNHQYNYEDHVRELKTTSGPGQNWLLHDMNYDNKEMIEWTMKNSNVVVNLLGPRKHLKNRKDFEWINITVPKRIAEACAKNPGVIRFIHFSACGANPHAESLDLQTKYIGEQEVLNAFPNATIFRPSVMVGDNDDFAYHWQVQKRYFHNFNIVPDNCQAKRQPIFVQDVAQAMLNALKMPETIGQTYELGGPHVYTLLECYEMFHNIVQRPPKLAHIDKQLLLKIAQYIPNWRYFNIDYILKHGDDMVVQVGSKTIDDLCVRPLSLTQALQNIFWDIQARYGGSSELYER
ncbi:unnamed protein product [Paramecium primaurelia]|uniref:NAD-dependent epimerase/dehydratase domain-containing protein n=1 Tax=Paramecium primaurelia TaxID=5886 RepID=A0A8S1LCT3_PARPR|nr:unnamed protein product [Paramecium primaurelia]